MIPRDLLDEVRAHAESVYPEECCGVILSARSCPDNLLSVRPCANVQDRFHVLDPVEFPRTNRTAYLIDPSDLIAIERECRETDQMIRVIYHSHPDAGVYFSAEDERLALADEEPLHPGVDYLVISAVDGRAVDSGLFTWNAEARKFVSA